LQGLAHLTQTDPQPPPPVLMVASAALSRYGFGDGHPFGPDRQEAFLREMRRSRAYASLRVVDPRIAERDELETFHLADYVDLVIRKSAEGKGYLDVGDTPASKGIYEASSMVVGGTLLAMEEIMGGRARRGFIPIAGLHHASRGHAAGFCVFNDCGIVIELLRKRHGLRRIAYVDIDAHHGDGVFYAFESDADALFADIHQDGRTLYPGTGAASETGKGNAVGTKLNLPLPPGAGDAEFHVEWAKVETYLRDTQPEFILLQCGADSLEGDPITHLALSEEAHAYAAAAVCRIADEIGHGRVLAMGGGGYNRQNLARAWTRVVEALVASQQ
jgi:acetoin utilization protein AcuC